MTLDADKQITELAREIIRDAGKPYTPEQLAVATKMLMILGVAVIFNSLVLLFNAFMQVNLEFWSGYIRSVGREESLRVLARFTDLIAAGEGDRAAQLLDDGLRRFVTTL